MRLYWHGALPSRQRVIVYLLVVLPVVGVFVPRCKVQAFPTAGARSSMSATSARVSPSVQEALAVSATSSSSDALPSLPPDPEAAPKQQRSQKRILFLRHGQTYMNEWIGGAKGVGFGAPNFTDVFVDEQDRLHKYVDSPLSEKGIQQAQHLHDTIHTALEMRMLTTSSSTTTTAESKEVEGNDDDDGALTAILKLDLVVTSPLTRALQTLDLALYPHIARRNQKNPGGSVPILAIPHAAERIYLVSDLGKPRNELKRSFPYVDFDSTAFESPRPLSHHLQSDKDDDLPWHYVPTAEAAGSYVEWRPHGEGQIYACQGEPQDVFDRRMTKLYKWLDDRSERYIAVVCHAGVIEWMTQQIFANCEMRLIDFDDLTPRNLI